MARAFNEDIAALRKAGEIIDTEPYCVGSMGQRFVRPKTIEDVVARTRKIAETQAKWGDDWRGAAKDEIRARAKKR